MSPHLMAARCASSPAAACSPSGRACLARAVCLHVAPRALLQRALLVDGVDSPVRLACTSHPAAACPGGGLISPLACSICTSHLFSDLGQIILKNYFSYRKNLASSPLLAFSWFRKKIKFRRATNVLPASPDIK